MTEVSPVKPDRLQRPAEWEASQEFLIRHGAEQNREEFKKLAKDDKVIQQIMQRTARDGGRVLNGSVSINQEVLEWVDTILKQHVSRLIEESAGYVAQWESLPADVDQRLHQVMRDYLIIHMRLTGDLVEI